MAEKKADVMDELFHDFESALDFLERHQPDSSEEDRPVEPAESGHKGD